MVGGADKASFKRLRLAAKAGQVALAICGKRMTAPTYVALIDAGNESPEAKRLLFFSIPFFDCKIKRCKYRFSRADGDMKPYPPVLRAEFLRFS